MHCHLPCCNRLKKTAREALFVIFWGKGVLLRPQGGYSEVKAGSHMSPMYLRHSHRYCLGHFADEWEPAPPATKSHRTVLPTEYLQSWTWANFEGILEVKTEMTNIASHFCSHNYQKSIPGSTGCHVAGALAAYENQALQWHKWWKDFLQFEINKLSALFPNSFCYFPKLCTAKSYAEPTVVFSSKLKCNSTIFSDLPGNRQP